MTISYCWWFLQKSGKLPQLRLVVYIPLFTMGFSTIPRWFSRRLSEASTLNDPDAARPLVLPALPRYLQVRKEGKEGGCLIGRCTQKCCLKIHFSKLTRWKLGDFLRGTWVQKWSHQVSSWVVATQIFFGILTPILREDEPNFEEHIFQMGWFNHQLLTNSKSPRIFCWLFLVGSLDTSSL